MRCKWEFSYFNVFPPYFVLEGEIYVRGVVVMMDRSDGSSCAKTCVYGRYISNTHGRSFVFIY